VREDWYQGTGGGCSTSREENRRERIHFQSIAYAEGRGVVASGSEPRKSLLFSGKEGNIAEKMA